MNLACEFEADKFLLPMFIRAEILHPRLEFEQRKAKQRTIQLSSGEMNRVVGL